MIDFNISGYYISFNEYASLQYLIENGYSKSLKLHLT